jgi:glycosyltransferase involved in cell wall biosynthesis
LPLKRLAVLSPLPPCQSGIADYCSQFLPYLVRHFEIDLYVDGYKVSEDLLSSAFRVFDVKDFEAVAKSYDLILYEFGNSEFHAHMLPLLERFPGVVGLHDAYLSGLFGYIDFNAGNLGSYEKELLSAHGPSARQYYAPVRMCPNSVEESMINLPCSKRVLDMATGIISHSPFNLKVARDQYPQGWLAPYRIIPQMVILPSPIPKEQRNHIRAELGFKHDDFILVTFGHVAWTKWGDRLLSAFLMSKLRNHANVHLIYAGKLSDDDFGTNINKAIKKAKLAGRIQITGFLTPDDYVKYLRIADLAIQLRTSSRGGTPKGVLDCLAYGVPVIVNNDASYTDYPDDVAIKLNSEPTVEALSEKIDFLFSNTELLQSFGERGRSYVKLRHDPSECAASYAAALNEFGARSISTESSSWVEKLAPFIACTADNVADAEQAASWLSSMRIPTWKRRRLYIDVSHIAQKDFETGIQRVVKELVRALYTAGFKGIEAIAVELNNGEIIEARAWCQSKGLLAPSENNATLSPIEFSSGDILLMLDSSWAQYDEFNPVFERARLANVPVITVVYDLLPITLPPGNITEGGSEWFEGWFRKAVKASDGLLCISKTVANEVIEYVGTHCPEKKSLKVGYWHLGSDFDHAESKDCNSARVIEVKKQKYLLTVGTIEPRKSHAKILEAMEHLWAQGFELSLCIAGKEGWMVGELMERMRTHPELGKRLFLIEKPTDSEISFLYQGALGLLFLSIDEGFGLPLVEAGHYGVPIICSDIPVFREIAGEYATYLNLESKQNISESLRKWMDACESGLLPDTHNMPRLTWEESAEQMVNIVINGQWLWRK